MVRGLLEMLGALQQRLGRNAAHVGAGASGSGAAFFVFPLVNAGHVQAQLRGANGRDIAAGACADNDDVKSVTHIVNLQKRWKVESQQTFNAEGGNNNCGSHT